MTIEIRVPKLPESVSDATLVAWRRKPGEAVGRDENLADLETDKVVLEVPAPAAGVLREIRVNAGATVRSGDLLALVEPAVAAAPAPAAGPAPASVAAVATPGTAAEPRLSPSVRRLVEEHRLDPTGIEGSGRDGRLTKSDVVGHLERARAAGDESAPPPQAVPAPVAAPAPAPAPSVAAGPRGEQRVPMTRLRQRIAERLVQVQRTAALLTTFNEVDLSAVNSLRARYKDRFEREHGVKLGYMSFFVKAAVEALRRFPIVNASVEGTDIVYHEYYDVGVAVSTDRGLVVPVVRDADQLGFAEIERRISDYGARARAGSLSLEELTGGTFTITNGGVFGSMLSTPIVNAPQSAILGMHSIRDRPVVVDGQVVVRPMMYLALSYDHRIIDGRDSVQFLVALKDALEDPGRILLGI